MHLQNIQESHFECQNRFYPILVGTNLNKESRVPLACVYMYNKA